VATVDASSNGTSGTTKRVTRVTPRTIAIDGPAGAGKSTIGALVAERLGYLFLDTGAMYRAIALAALKNGVDPDDAERLAKLARESRIAIGPPTVRDGRAYTVLLDGADVTWDIRSPEVDRTVSQVARVPAVRDIMVDQQRDLARRGRVVMVGRDIGTVVLPDADRKIYLTASAAERAKRREEELRSRGQVRPRQELLQEILGRDRMDSERKVAPLRTADDAAVVQTDGLSVGQALEKVLAIVTRPAPAA
jgi:cytidylate kinase